MTSAPAGSIASLEGEGKDQGLPVEQNVNLLDPDANLDLLIERLRDGARETDGVSVVVIDTLNRAMSGGNENAPDDMGLMITAAGRILTRGSRGTRP